ncbi:hypothetical protein FNV43_RR13328 [Rhamnella rubrinervis]|uniref:Uncharacterized protein n=1 Tax=Rhamnella rubrinervis TaxID=2594499 RepID=A0A8K0H117_9ROSA|nr:hypothetical protein FNV43_RR13328 [Rhamnella rubrinervis]
MQLAQDCRYLYEVAIKADNAWKKKTMMLNNLAATNKSLEEEVQHLIQIAVGATNKTEQLKKNWPEADLKLTKKEEELRNLRLDFSRLALERDELQAQAAVWLNKRKIVCCKGVEDAFLKAKRQMIRRFKAHPRAERRQGWRDSFMKAMDAVKTEGPGPITNTEVSSAAEPNQEDLP